MGDPCRKKTMAGSSVGLYSLANGLDTTFTIEASNESTSVSRIAANSCSNSSHLGQFGLP